MTTVSRKEELIEAFFWIEATRPDANSQYQPKVLWHSPDSVSHITKEHKDIPHYCFPDMNRIQIEKAQDLTSEFFSFSVLSGDGQRYYGFCYRHLFRGTARRFDVGRRTKHCLCLISAHPYFAFFKSLLMHIYGVAMLERFPGQCKTYAQGFLRTISEMPSNRINISTMTEPGIFPPTMPISQSAALQKLLPTVSWSVPKTGQTPYRDFLLLPLFETVGVDKFFKVFSAALCEKKIVFVSDDVNLLSTVIMSTAAMLHPFTWSHTIVTVLPHKLINQVAAPIPYLIGLKRQSYGSLRPEQLDGILVVDLDSGDVNPRGDCVLKDLVGDAGNAFKQASEGLDRVRAGVASVFLGKSSESDNAQQRDIMPMLYLDLKSMMNSKPGSSSISSVASGLLQKVSASKSVAESKAQWTLEAEKVLRDSLACFFVFLFADLEDFILPSSESVKGSTTSVKTHNEVRSRFDMRGFLQKKKTNGASKLMMDFLMEFVHSQMFEQYCSHRLNAPAVHRSSRTTSAASSNSSTSSADEDLFVSSSFELMARQVPHTANYVKQAVLSRSSSLPMSDTVDAPATASKIFTGQFHIGTLQYTQASSTDADMINALSVYDIDISSLSNNLGKHNRAAAQQSLLDRIVSDSFSSSMLRRIFATVKFRLETCSAARSKGSAGIAGCKALIAMYTILVQGQLSSISFALDLIPTLRTILRYSPKQTSALDFTASQFYDARPLATLVFELLIDHKRLLVQRLHYILSKGVEQSGAMTKRKNSAIPKDLFTLQSDGSKKFPSFADLHHQFNDLNLASVSPDILVLTVPVRAVAEKEEGQDDGEESLGTGAYHESSVSTPSMHPSSRVATSNKSSDSLPSMGSQKKSSGNLASQPAPEVNLLDFDGGLVDDTAKYRALNKDTGEVLDLRKFEKPNAPYPFPYSTPSNAPALKLKPPPSDAVAPRRRPGAAFSQGSISPTQTSGQSKTAASFDFDNFTPTLPNPPAPSSRSNDDFAGMAWGTPVAPPAAAPPVNPFASSGGWPGASSTGASSAPFASPGILPPPQGISYAAKPKQSKPEDPFASLLDFK